MKQFETTFKNKPNFAVSKIERDHDSNRLYEQRQFSNEELLQNVDFFIKQSKIGRVNFQGAVLFDQINNFVQLVFRDETMQDYTSYQIRFN